MNDDDLLTQMFEEMGVTVVDVTPKEERDDESNI